jgi:hypothetical protein
MVLTALAVLIGGTMAWRGRVAAVPNAAALRRAAVAVNRQAMRFAVMFLIALMPAIRIAAEEWLVAALALCGIFTLLLFGMRARWQSRARQTWESSVQQSMLRTLLPPAPVYVMAPATPAPLRDAA